MMSTEIVCIQMGAPSLVAQAIEKICADYEISDTMEKSHFIAQMFVESQNFTKVEENLRYSVKRMAEVWPARYALDPKAKIKAPNARALAVGNYNPQGLANDTYNGRMGNRVGSNDGWDYRGRAYKMITGSDNYMAYSMWAYGDDRVHKTPDMLLSLPDSVRSGAWFWITNNLGIWARKNDVLAVSRGVNLGNVNSTATPLGLKEREIATARAFSEFAKLTQS